MEAQCSVCGLPQYAHEMTQHTFGLLDDLAYAPRVMGRPDAGWVLTATAVPETVRTCLACAPELPSGPMILSRHLDRYGLPRAPQQALTGAQARARVQHLRRQAAEARRHGRARQADYLTRQAERAHGQERHRG